MFRLILGLAAGYILGARAGRERYEQITLLVARAKGSPAIQGAAGFVAAKATSLLRNKKPKASRPDPAYLPDDAEPSTDWSQPGRVNPDFDPPG